MTTEADLERLADLHRRGLITDKDYDDQRTRVLKGQRRPWRHRKLFWGLALLVFVLYSAFGPSSRSGGGFPPCDSNATRHLLKQAVESGADTRVQHRLLMVDNVRELSFDAASKDRMCVGNAVLNTGEQRIIWRMYQRGENVILTVTD